MRKILLVLALLNLAGCATWSQQEIDARMIDSERTCDASFATGHASFWTRLNCMRRPPLPPECDAPGTDDMQACRQWAQEQRDNDQTTAVINTILY